MTYNLTTSQSNTEQACNANRRFVKLFIITYRHFHVATLPHELQTWCVRANMNETKPKTKQRVDHNSKR